METIKRSVVARGWGNRDGVGKTGETQGIFRTLKLFFMLL